MVVKNSFGRKIRLFDVIIGENFPLIQPRFCEKRISSVQSNSEIVRVIGVSVLSQLKLRENIKAFFSQGQSKLSVIKRCPGVHKARFNCN